MKSDITTTAAVPAADDRLWRGLEEYMDTPEFRASLADEFPEDAAEWSDPVTRRRFMTLMGASLALAGAGCSVRPAPQRKITPYTEQPDQLTPGVPLMFATSMPLAGYSVGVLVRSHEGRPVKVEGNPGHPASLGGAGVFEQASVLDMYDPDRSRAVNWQGTPSSYENAVAALRARVDENGGELRILSGTVTSPTLAELITQLLDRVPGSKWVQFDPVARENAREGARKAFGRPVNVYYDFLKADVVVSLDADLFESDPGRNRYSRDFAARRKVRVHGGGVAPQQMSRVYAVESMPGTIGAGADHRMTLLASQVEPFGRALAAALNVAGAPAAGGGLPKLAADWIAPLVKDLQAHRGKSLVVAGDHLPPSAHALALAINAALGNIGQTVLVTAPVEARPEGKVSDLETLVKEMAAGQVGTLVVLGSNPAYTAPADVPFLDAMKKVPFKFHLGQYIDETSAWCDWHVNEAHYLEAWGDGRAYDGTAGVQQPLIAPLYDGKSAIELFADVLRSPVRDGLELVRAYWKKTKFPGENSAPDFEKFWQETLRTGVVADSAAKPEGNAALAGNWAEGAAPAASPPAAGKFELNIRLDPNLLDGRFANNAWLQELPKPVTRISWDNCVFVSPKTFAELKGEKDYRWTAGERGRTEVSILEVTYQGRSVRGPVWPLPGHPDNAVTVHLGHGRLRAGRVGSAVSELNPDGVPTHGFDAFALRTAAAPWTAAGATVANTGKTYFVACVQANWSMVDHSTIMGHKDPTTGQPLDRKPARRMTVAEYLKNPELARIPPTAAGETEAINKNVPSSVTQGKDDGSGVQQRFGNQPPHADDHAGHGHGKKDDKAAANGEKKADDHHAGHDPRLIPLTMYQPNDNLYPGLRTEQARRWAMAIDLGACNGCNACTIACQSENNIPTVGKYEVTRAHDMYWIRVDRYYSGQPDDATKLETYFQPVPCQQCEKAPCEIVCPVGATVHSADGLNDMVYNRCVGTRYCSNNCPYKVRRFNFLTYQDWATDSLKLGRNPDVSVRSRGVMEKCTYCVQRLRGAEIVAEREGRPIRDGEARTACQSACPSNAISFGDLNDPAAEVGRWKTEPTNYGLLAELNTMPRTTYLAAVKNPNPEMPH